MIESWASRCLRFSPPRLADACFRRCSRTCDAAPVSASAAVCSAAEDGVCWLAYDGEDADAEESDAADAWATSFFVENAPGEDEDEEDEEDPEKLAEGDDPKGEVDEEVRLPFLRASQSFASIPFSAFRLAFGLSPGSLYLPYRSARSELDITRSISFLQSFVGS